MSEFWGDQRLGAEIYPEKQVEKLRKEIETLRARVKELEQERGDWANTGRWADEKRLAAEARIDKVRGLVEKWREGDFDLPDYTRGKMDGLHQCSKELMAALGD